MSEPTQSPYLILHKVRGESAFDIAIKINHLHLDEEMWIIPTSGHRAYPFAKWSLEDLADISDINNLGIHERPAHNAFIPDDWPDHYQGATLAPRRVKIEASAEDLLTLFGRSP